MTGDVTSPRGADADADGHDAVVLRAHAKLTLRLAMTGLRDDGYHLIDAEMVSLELHDLIEIRPVDDGGEVDASSSMTVGGPYADGVPTDAGNLVLRALERCDRHASVHVDKRIPHGGGLGGGSTDAAAVLRWGGWDTAPETLAAASALGADIPFCMVGGRARVSGIGEVVEPLAPVDEEITLVIPPLRVSTPAAYRAWDELGGPHGDGPNDLEAAAIAVEPRLAWWRDTIAERAGLQPVLAGSGATWFLRGRRDNALADLVDEGARVVATRTVTPTF